MFAGIYLGNHQCLLALTRESSEFVGIYHANHQCLLAFTQAQTTGEFEESDLW